MLSVIKGLYLSLLCLRISARAWYRAATPEPRTPLFSRPRPPSGVRPYSRAALRNAAAHERMAGRYPCRREALTGHWTLNPPMRSDSPNSPNPPSPPPPQAPALLAATD
eukprot:scaffold14467_cov101-Isochrysis_galbana.AAC.1